MHRKYRHTALLLIALLVSQSVLAANVHVCRNNGMTGGEGKITASAEHHHVMQHGNAASHNNNQQKSSCDCGNYCAGTCMHACYGPAVVTRNDTLFHALNGGQAELPGSRFMQGFTTHPLRPPAVS